MDCRQAFCLFPNGRVLVSGRWRAPYHFDTVVDPDVDVEDLALGVGRVTKPIGFCRMSGSTPADLMGTADATVNIVSGRFVSVLRSVAATGWSLFPVELRLKADEPLPGYHGLSITGRAGPVQSELASDVIFRPFPGSAPAAGKRGWCFEPETWDGSDVFTPDGHAALCVTEPVAEVLRASALTGLRTARMSDIEMIKV